MTALAAVLVAGAIWLFLPESPTRAQLGPPSGNANTNSARESRAADVVEQLERALESGDAAAAAELAGVNARAARELRRLTTTARDLDLTLLDLRYVSGRSPSVRDRERWGAEAFVADVQLSWQLAGLDPQPSTVETPVVLVDDGTNTSFVTARKSAARVPIWWNDRVEVQRPREGVLIVRSGGAAGEDLADMALEGVRTVRAALPSWDGQAIIEAPSSSKRFAQVSGLAPEAARGLAAVTTSSDGALARGTPQRVFLNPAVFGPLGTTGQQIVVSHELTHVAVDGASSAMPLWLSEGYADYVALRRAEIPVRTAAAQILRLVRAEGPPRSLPSGEQFDGTDPNVGAWYESAWLAARLLANEYGEPALNAFYRQADRDGGTDRAFERLGTTEQAFTQLWRAKLERLAQ